MTTRAHGGDWLPAFLAWAAEPSPTGEWVYRGQAAHYGKIEPSGLREPHRAVYRNQLYDIDYGLTREVFRTSPVFQASPLYRDQIEDDLGRRIERLAYSFFGGPPIVHPQLGFSEVIRALAQHYGYATLFVDVSLNPIVAALFATHRWTSDGYAVDHEKEGTVYRWPAVRASPSRLQIAPETPGEIQVIDISRINPHARRPYNQRAALATPVRDPKPFFQPFGSPISALELTDMMGLPGCESFRILPGGGCRLLELKGVSMEALFPDTIDLLHSYINVAAFLSLLLPRSSDLPDLPERHILEGIGRTALLVAGAILDRECLRTVEGLAPPPTLSGMTVQEARIQLGRLGRAGRKAIDLIETEENVRKVEPLLREHQTRTQAELDRRVAVLRKALGPDHEVVTDPALLQVEIRNGGRPPWLLEQLERRLQQVESILAICELVPVYALERPMDFAAHLAALPSNEDYEQRVRKQLEAQRLWVSCELFAH